MSYPVQYQCVECGCPVDLRDTRSGADLGVSIKRQCRNCKSEKADRVIRGEDYQHLLLRIQYLEEHSDILKSPPKETAKDG